MSDSAITLHDTRVTDALDYVGLARENAVFAAEFLMPEFAAEAVDALVSAIVRAVATGADFGAIAEAAGTHRDMVMAIALAHALEADPL